MSSYQVPVDGWKQHSVWGYDSTTETYYADLYKDDSDPQAEPLIRLPRGRGDKLTTAGELALAIVTEIGSNFDMLLVAMVQTLRDARPTDPRSLPLAGKLRAAFPDNKDAEVFASMLGKCYSGEYKMNALEALLCLKVGAEAALRTLYPNSYGVVGGEDEIIAASQKAQALRDQEATS